MQGFGRDGTPTPAKAVEPPPPPPPGLRRNLLLTFVEGPGVGPHFPFFRVGAP